MNQKTKVQKISQADQNKFEYSRLVTEKFCSLLKEGKIMLNDQMKAIDLLCNIMHPQTVNDYREPGLNYYNSVKGAIESGKLMYFKIGKVIFIPQQ